MPASGYIDDGNTHNTLDYFMTMDIGVKNIDKRDNKTWRIIYKEIGVPYFVGVKLFTEAFIYHCKKHPNEPKKFHLKSRRILKPPP